MVTQNVASVCKGDAKTRARAMWSDAFATLRSEVTKMRPLRAAPLIVPKTSRHFVHASNEPSTAGAIFSTNITDQKMHPGCTQICHFFFSPSRSLSTRRAKRAPHSILQFRQLRHSLPAHEDSARTIPTQRLRPISVSKRGPRRGELPFCSGQPLTRRNDFKSVVSALKSVA